MILNRKTLSLIVVAITARCSSAFTGPHIAPSLATKSIFGLTKPTWSTLPAEAATETPAGTAVLRRDPPPPDSVSPSASIMESPAKAFQLMSDKGKINAKNSVIKNFVSAMLGGCYVGMGGMVSLAISGNMPGIATANPGLARLFFAMLFPVNLLLCIQAGGQLFTGNTAYMTASYCEKKTTIKDMLRVLGISYVGNAIAGALFAMTCKYCGVLSGGAADLAIQTLTKKTSMAFGPCFVKAFLCNWLVCLAVYMSFQARDMTGKYVSILLPISTFVAIGFEHSVANMFLLPAGLLCSTGGSIKTILLKNMLPVTLGNIISGSLMVGIVLSFMFGRLGEGK